MFTRLSRTSQNTQCKFCSISELFCTSFLNISVGAGGQHTIAHDRGSNERPPARDPLYLIDSIMLDPSIGRDPLYL